MGFRTEVGAGGHHRHRDARCPAVEDNERITGEMRARLPKNRELLRKIYDYGLQPI